LPLVPIAAKFRRHTLSRLPIVDGGLPFLKSHF
jgi:hypothetical protein